MPAAQALVDLGINATSSARRVVSTTATALATEAVQSFSSSGVATGGVVGAAIGSAVAGIAIGLFAG